MNLRNLSQEELNAKIAEAVETLKNTKNEQANLSARCYENVMHVLARELFFLLMASRINFPADVDIRAAAERA